MQELTPEGLARVRHPDLRREAEAALSRGEAVQLHEGTSEGAPVQTVVLGKAGRAGQSLGTTATWGEWLGGRLHTAEAGHMFDVDGRCTCPACDLAAGYFGDDDE